MRTRPPRCRLEEEELALLYQAKGVPVDQPKAIARQIITGDSRAALDALSREELSIDPNELGGSAWVAAGTSFTMFALGALVPLARPRSSPPRS